MSGRAEGEGASVLLVEDEEDIRRMLGMALRMRGYQVLEAGDGAAALQLLEQAPRLPGLIFLDLMMPGMDGEEFLRRRDRDARLREIPLVVLSGRGCGEQRREGVQGFMHKPVGLRDILDMTEKYLGAK